MKLSVIAFRNISRNTRRSILSGTAIAVAAMSIVILFSLIAGMRADFRSNLVRYITGDIRLRTAEYDENAHLFPLGEAMINAGTLVEELDQVQGVTAVSPRVQFPTAIYQEGRTSNALGFGMDFENEEEYQNIGDYIIEGRLPEAGENETILGQGLSNELGLSVGDSFTILSRTRGRGTNAITLHITGLINFTTAGMGNRTFLAPLDRIQYFLRMPDTATEILVRVDDPENSQAVETRIESLIAQQGRDEIQARRLEDISEMFGFMELAQQIYNFIALVFFILASTVIVNTTMMVIYERYREIGTIAAMGMTGGEIVRLFFIEAFYIGLIGSAIGVLLGIGITIPLSIFGIDLTAAMEGIDIEMSGTIKTQLSWYSTVVVFLYSTVIASIASLLPSRRAAKVEPVEALRSV
ncbi:MAG: ABC transporter permease [Spirochaetia bacterium]